MSSLFSKINTVSDLVFHLPFIARRQVQIDLLPPNDPLQWVYWDVQASGDLDADRSLGQWYSQLTLAASPRWGQIMRTDGVAVEDHELAALVVAGAIDLATARGGTGLEEGLFKHFSEAVHRGSLN